jgi:hypothetical protein
MRHAPNRARDPAMVSVRMIRSRPAVAALGLVIGGMMWTVETGRSKRDGGN